MIDPTGKDPKNIKKVICDMEKGGYTVMDSCKSIRDYNLIGEANPNGDISGIYMLSHRMYDKLESRHLAYCDMEYNKGGWTLIMKSNGNSTFNYESDYWKSEEPLHKEDLNLDLDNNAKFPSYYHTFFMESRLVINNTVLLITTDNHGNETTMLKYMRNDYCKMYAKDEEGYSTSYPNDFNYIMVN
jgi:hypothetical protein